MRVDFQPFKTRETAWDPERDAHVSMNVRLDGCIVPTEEGDVGARVSYSHVVVLDDFVDERSRLQLLHHLSENVEGGEIRLRGDVWDRKTLDMDGGCPTWGVKNDVIQTLQDASLDSVLEIQSRLVKLYPEYKIVFMPSDAIQEPGQGGNCSNILVNAASPEDTYVYHQDADPTSFPSSSPWVQQYGEYFNGEPNKPLLVSLLIYLNSEWHRDWAADTSFLMQLEPTLEFLSDLVLAGLFSCIKTVYIECLHRHQWPRGTLGLVLYGSLHSFQKILQAAQVFRGLNGGHQCLLDPHQRFKMF
eukprot:jgi/Picre1/31003/NNA_006361.t1